VRRRRAATSRCGLRRRRLGASCGRRPSGANRPCNGAIDTDVHRARRARSPSAEDRPRRTERTPFARASLPHGERRTTGRVAPSDDARGTCGVGARPRWHPGRRGTGARGGLRRRCVGGNLGRLRRASSRRWVRGGRGRGRRLGKDRSRSRSRCRGGHGGLRDRCRRAHGRSGHRGDRHGRRGGRGRRSSHRSRSGDGTRRSRRSRGRGGRLRRSGHRARRQVAEWIDVALRLGRETDPQVHIGACDLGVAARADRADRVPLGDRRILRDANRAEVRERDGEPVGRGDRDAPARARDRAGEGHRPGGRRTHGRTCLGGDVDPAMLARGVRVRRVERELLDDGAGDGPGPGLRGRRGEERGNGRDEKQATHRHHLCCPRRERSEHGRSDVVRCQKRLQTCHKERR
jgi:hypothetical protein